MRYRRRDAWRGQVGQHAGGGEQLVGLAIEQVGSRST
jgi:hypothetical protein